MSDTIAHLAEVQAARQELRSVWRESEGLERMTEAQSDRATEALCRIIDAQALLIGALRDEVDALTGEGRRSIN